MQVRLTDGTFITRVSNHSTSTLTYDGVVFRVTERSDDTLYVAVLQPNTLEGYLHLVLSFSDEKYATWYQYTTPERDYDFFPTRTKALAYYNPSKWQGTLVYKVVDVWYASWQAGDVHCSAPTLAQLLSDYTEACSFVKYDYD